MRNPLMKEMTKFCFLKFIMWHFTPEETMSSMSKHLIDLLLPVGVDILLVAPQKKKMISLF